MSIRKILLTIAILSGSLNMVANHVLGGHITWQCLGGDQYQLTFVQYKDCYGTPGEPAQENIFLYPSGCGSLPFSAILNYVSTVEVSDLCPTELANSSCVGGIAPGTVQVTYTGTVTLAPGCVWDVIWNDGDWNYFANTTALPQNAYIHTLINTSICSNSVSITSNFAAPQVQYICFNQPFSHPVVVPNPSGYTLSYSIVNPLTTGAAINNPITANGYSTPAGLTINPTTGVVSWNNAGPPNINFFGNYLFTVAITMTDAGGVNVGTIFENMVFVVRNCTPTVTTFNNPPITAVGSNTTQVNNTTVEVCAGGTLNFNVRASNPVVSRTITLSFTPVTGLPGLTMTQTGTNPANGTFNLVTTGAMVGTYTLQINAIDDACPNPGTDNTTITIIVHPNVQLNITNTTICLGQSVNLIASGLSGNNYTWSVLPGGDATSGLSGNGGSQNVNPDFTTTFQVNGVGIPAQCQATATALVNVSLSGISAVTTNETCGNNNGAIDITISGDGSGNYQYDWTDVPGPANTEDRTGLNGGQNYTVIVTDLTFNCTIQGTYAVGDVPAPAATFTGGTTICNGDCTNLTIDFTAGTGPFNVVISPVIAGLVVTGVADPFTFQVCPTANTTYTITSITDASGCVANLNISQDVNVRPLITGAFSPQSALCSGQNLNLVVDYTGTPAGTYSVVYSINNVNQPPVQLADLGTINVGPVAATTTYDIESISYTNAPLCPSTDASNPPITVTVNPLPTVNLGTGGGICNTGSFNINMTLTGTGPWTVGYTANGVAQTALNVASSPFVWTVSPTSTTNYCITSVSDANCSNPNNSGLNQCAQVLVTPFPTVNYSINNTQLCPGQQATITVTVSPAGLWTANFVQIPDNAMPETFTSQGSAILPNVPFTYNITPAVTTTYRLVDVFFDGAPQCATTLNQNIVVNVNGLISVQSTDTVCNNISTQYQVVYTVSGGNGTYSEAPALPNGTFAGNVFTTQNIASGSGGTWTFSDSNNCNQVLMTMNPYTCPVLTNAGTMNVTPISICGTGAANATWNNNGFLDGNDQQMFVLHTGSGTTFGTVVATNCAAPTFTFGAGMTYGTTYYISSVAGDDAGDGTCVNLAAPNVQVSAGTPVTWYETPTATLSAPAGSSACQGSTVTLSVAFTGTGPWTFVHSIAGTNQAAITTNVNPYTFTTATAGSFALVSVTSGPGNACTGTVSGTVNVIINPLPTAILSASASTCQGTNHCFSIALTGAAPWTVVINNPDPLDETINAANTPFSYCVGAAGNYQIVSVTDANNCANSTASTSVSLTVNPLPTIAWAFADTSFCQGSGIQLIANTTGSSPFQVSITSPDTDLTSPWNAQSATIDVAGTYTINSITDNNGCQNTATTSINVQQIATPIANAGPDVEQCSGFDVVLGTPAQPNHTYSWSPTTGMAAGAAITAQPTVNIINDTAVDAVYNYTVTAQVAQCTFSDQVQLIVHPLPVASVEADDNIICLGATATLTASGGNVYAWQASPSIQSGINAAIATVAPTANETFVVEVSQSYGALLCSSTAQVSIEVGSVLQVNENFTAQLCYNTCNGFINLIATGSFPPYNVDPTSDIPAFTNNNLCPGTYNYTVVDQQGCTFTSSIFIEERQPELIDQIIVTQPICAYDLGTIEIIDNTTSYGINGCSINLTNQTGLFNNLVPCDYTITTIYQVAPNEFCVTDSIVTIAPISPDIQFNPLWTSQQYCFEDQVCFQANPSGGLGNLDVRWFNCESVLPACEISANNPHCIALTEDTTLWGYATDQMGCRSDTVQVVATLAPAISLVVQNGANSVAICEYDCAQLQATASGGNGNITVSWFQMPFTQNSFAQGLEVTLCPFVTTDYFAVASDGCSQSLTDSIRVVVNDTPEPLFDVNITEGCFPLVVEFYDLSPPFADNYTCSWNFGNGQSFNQCDDTLTYAYPGFGQFYPILTHTSQFGCVGSDTLEFPINIYGYPEINFTWDPQPVNVLENKVEFTNLTQGAVSYNWNFYNSGSTSAVNPIHTFPVVDQGIFQVCLEATSPRGCIDTLCQNILVESVLGVFVPNAFTPDEDGINDVFLPVITGAKFGTYRLWIYDRWGTQIFTTDDPKMAWTGNAMDGEYYVQNDTFVWRIEVEEARDGRIRVFEGLVTILR